MGRIRNKLFNFFRNFRDRKATFKEIQKIASDYNIPPLKRDPSQNLPSSTLLNPQEMYNAEYELARTNRMLNGDYFREIAEENINNMFDTVKPFLSDEASSQIEEMDISDAIDFYNLATNETILGKTESIMYSDTEILNIIYHTHQWDRLYVLTDTFERLLNMFSSGDISFENYNDAINKIREAGL